MISDDEYDSPPPKQPKRRLCYCLTGIPIVSQQGEEEAKQDIHHPTTTDFNLNGTASSTKPLVIEEEEYKQPTTAASKLFRYHHRFGNI